MNYLLHSYVVLDFYDILEWPHNLYNTKSIFCQFILKVIKEKLLNRTFQTSMASCYEKSTLHWWSMILRLELDLGVAWLASWKNKEIPYGFILFFGVVSKWDNTVITKYSISQIPFRARAIQRWLHLWYQQTHRADTATQGDQNYFLKLCLIVRNSSLYSIQNCPILYLTYIGNKN